MDTDNTEVYIDLELFDHTVDGELVVSISAEDLEALIDFHPNLVIRNWDGRRPTVLYNSPSRACDDL